MTITTKDNPSPRPEPVAPATDISDKARIARIQGNVRCVAAALFFAALIGAVAAAFLPHPSPETWPVIKIVLQMGILTGLGGAMGCLLYAYDAALPPEERRNAPRMK